MSYSPENLAYIATVINAAAAARDWSIGLDSKRPVTIEEVQCMQIDGEDKVYIACNSREDQKVRNFLSSFTTNSKATFEDCLAISHWFLSLPHATLTNHNKQRAKEGRSTVKFASEYKIKYSGQDLNVISAFTAPPFLAAAHTQGATIYDNLYNGGARGWFVRKFADVNNPTNAIKTPGEPLALLEVFSAAQSVNVLGNSQVGLHAELVLLSFLASEIVANPQLYADKVVHLGGAKKACAHCASWIALYKRWMLNKYRVTVKTPGDGTIPDARTRANEAENATRPTNETLSRLSGAPALLFTGGAAGNGSDLRAMSQNEDLWQR